MADGARSPHGVSLIRTAYLGDGVYAGHDGFQVWLWADSAGQRNWVAIDHSVAPAIIRYLNGAWKPATPEEIAALREGADG